MMKKKKPAESEGQTRADMPQQSAVVACGSPSLLFTVLCCVVVCLCSGATALPVRVNLPSELGGGFTMLMLFPASGQSVRDFIRSVVAMLQTTNATLLRSDDYGLTPHAARDEQGRDASGAPPVFLHPESRLADAFDDSPELHLDLRRLPGRATQVAQQGREEPAGGAPGHSRSYSTSGAPPSPSSATAASSAAAAAAAAAARLPPPAPTPPAHAALHASTLSKLRRLRPPADLPPNVLVLTSLTPPCSLPASLARSVQLPADLSTSALQLALSSRQVSVPASASASAQSIAASSAGSVARASPQPESSPPSGKEPSRKEKREAERLARKLDEYAAHVYDLLLARGIGDDPQTKLQMATAALVGNKSSRPRAGGGERIGTSAAMGSGGDEMWGGWDESPLPPSHREEAERMEVPLLFVATAKLPDPLPKRYDVTQGPTQADTSRHASLALVFCSACLLPSTHLVGSSL